MAATTIIDLLRHGEPEGGSRYRGHTIDDPLTAEGWRQMWRGVGSAVSWDMVLTSPLLRCSQFAEALGERFEIPVVINEQLKEIGFGDWEGKTKEQLRQERLDEFNAFYADPLHNTPPGAEPLGDFFQRISSLIDLLSTHHPGRRLLLVTHAGVTRAALTHAIGADVACMYRLNISNGGLSRVRIADGRGRLELLNGRLD